MQKHYSYNAYCDRVRKIFIHTQQKERTRPPGCYGNREPIPPKTVAQHKCIRTQRKRSQTKGSINTVTPKRLG